LQWEDRDHHREQFTTLLEVLACIKDKLRFCEEQQAAQQETDLNQGKEEV